jgi:hypothetical protein
MLKRLVALATTAGVWLMPAIASAAEKPDSEWFVTRGVSGVWVLCNVSFAGMRAQNHPSQGWRIAAFIFGFPGTLITILAVPEGECRAYGVQLPPGDGTRGGVR